MVATLRLVLDQLVSPSSPDFESASLETARALVRTMPKGCEVAAIAPAGESLIEQRVPSIGAVKRSALGRRELLAAWQLGVAPSLGGGLIHSSTLAAPLVRHDRVNNGDQTVVTVWDVDAWEHPERMARGSVTWTKAMMKRAQRFADAVVVPTYHLAARVEELTGMGERIRVIAGAAPHGFQVPNDSCARLRDLQLPERFVLLCAGSADGELLDGLRAAAAVISDDLQLVVLDAEPGQESIVAETASAAGIPERWVHVRTGIHPADRAAVMGASQAFVHTAQCATWPWRAVEALALGVPVVAAESPTSREVLGDGAVLADVADLGDALRGIVDPVAQQRARVLAADRGRAFSWDGAGEQIWQLHAQL